MSEFLDEIIARFCGKALSPVDFTALFRYLLIDYFSNSSNILEPSLKDIVYTDDDTTQIIIEAAGRWKPSTGDHRPAILISRGEWKVVPYMLGMNYIQGTEPSIYLRRYQGSHNIICVGKTSAQADILGGEVLHFFVGVIPPLRERLPISYLNVEGLSAVQPFDEGRTHFITTIPITYSFELRWTIGVTTSPEP